MALPSLDYIAGFFDGEGCIHLQSQHKYCNYYLLTVILSNTDGLIIYDIQKVIGGNVNVRRLSSGRNDYKLVLTGIKAYEYLMENFHLLRVKRQQAELAIDFYEYMLEGKKRRERRKPQDRVAIEKWYSTKITELKKAGSL